MIWRFC